MSASAVRAFPSRGRSPASHGLLANLLHLAGHGRQVVEAPRRFRSEVAALEGRLELNGSQERVACRLVRLAGQSAPARLLQGLGSFSRELGRRRAVQVGEERRRVVEVVRADLEQLVARSLAEPLRKARMVTRPRRFRQARVGDIADEDVLEAISGLVRER